MITYSGSNRVETITFFALSAFGVSSFIWDFKLFGFKLYPFIVFLWLFFFIAVLAYLIEKRVSKIILDLNRGEIILEEVSTFNTKRKVYIWPIRDVNCYIYIKPMARGGTSPNFKIEIGENTSFDFSVNDYGWSKKNLEDLIKQIDKYKSSIH